MKVMKSNEKIEFDFEVSRDTAPRFWGRYYLKPLNNKAQECLLENFDPDFQVWDEKRGAIQLDQRDMEEWMDIIDHSEFQGNWRKEED